MLPGRRLRSCFLIGCDGGELVGQPFELLDRTQILGGDGFRNKGSTQLVDPVFHSVKK